MAAKLLERSGATIFDFNVRVPFFGLGIDGNVFLQMPLEPAPVVQRFANGDAVKPSFQGAAPAEISNATKGFQETSWVPSAASEVSPSIPRMRL